MGKYYRKILAKLRQDIQTLIVEKLTRLLEGTFRESANDATRATNKQYARQKSCYYHYHQYTRPYHEESKLDL